MKIEELLSLIEGKVVTNTYYHHLDITHGLSSDLMSDVLTLETENTALITGLANVQAIRTGEMLDIHCIIIARNKRVTPEMKAVAEQCGITLIETPFSVFKSVGILYQHGIQPVY
jgi:hypothetical protein